MEIAENLVPERDVRRKRPGLGGGKRRSGYHSLIDFRERLHPKTFLVS